MAYTPELISRLPQRPLAVYVHWPYCAAICNYCDFVKRVPPAGMLDKDSTKESAFAGRLHTALRRNLARIAQNNPASTTLITSVYFGGGTPSLARPGSLANVLEAADVNSSLEVTLEANPTPGERRGSFEGYRAAGITRVSVRTLHSSLSRSILVGVLHFFLTPSYYRQSFFFSRLACRPWIMNSCDSWDGSIRQKRP